MKWESFEKKNVYISGGSSGIGLCTAKKLAGLGADIFIFARDERRLKEAAAAIKKLRQNHSCTVSCMSADITDPGKVQAVIDETVEKYGAPDILINCAGRAIPDYVESITHEQFRQTLQINLFGTWNMISSALPYMKKNGGTIVNTSSVAGFLGIFGYADYAASKFGIIGLSEAIRSELKRYGITVSVLCPPDTRTPGYNKENRTKPAETRALSEGAGLLEPDQVAESLIKGITRGKKMIIPGFKTKMTWYLKRWCPDLVELLMDRTIRKVQAKKSRQVP